MAESVFEIIEEKGGDKFNLNNVYDVYTKTDKMGFDFY